jgi:hypothetical protein
MPPYYSLEMGGAEIDHSQMTEPIRGPVVAFEVFPSHVETLTDSNPEDGAQVSCSESVSSSTTTSSSSNKKRVSFAALHIRNHSVILGDHPCCTVGLPVTLDWTVESEISVDLEAYEATRERRRSRPEMLLSVDDRNTLLSDMAQGDLRRVQRKLHKERRCSGRAKNMFFSSDDELKKQAVAVTTATALVGSSE